MTMLAADPAVAGARIASPSIRDSRTDDVPAIREIYAFHVRHGLASFEEEPPTVEEMAGRRAAVLDQGYPHLVAELDGEVAGVLPCEFRISTRKLRVLGTAHPIP